MCSDIVWICHMAAVSGIFDILCCDPGRCLELKIPIYFLLWFQYDFFMIGIYDFFMIFLWIQKARFFNMIFFYDFLMISLGVSLLFIKISKKNRKIIK